MAGLIAPVKAELDERSATESANRMERAFSEATRDISRNISTQLGGAAREGGKAMEKMADDARAAYRKVGDATDEVTRQEKQLQDMRERGARGTEVQAERVRQARQRETAAIREAANAMESYERSARQAGEAGEDASSKVVSGFGGIASALRGAGGEAAGGFAEGFAGSSALASLGTRAGPIGLALAGAAALGYATGKTLIDQVAAGMASLSIQDSFQASIGIDSATAARFGNAAGKAYTNAFGESIQANMNTAQFGIQARLIAPTANDADVQRYIQQTQALSGLTQEDPNDVARGARNLVTGGLAANYQQAYDLLAAAQQRGLNLSHDLIDTTEEYSTKFRDLGLTGADALGLINQMLAGGARNTDQAADAIKEFQINASDNSKLTRQAFQALGFDADEMSRKFTEGGPAAREAFGEILTALNGITDPMDRQQVGLALFKTKWEDLGQAIKTADLNTAAGSLGQVDGAMQNASDTMGRHIDQWDALGRKIDTTVQSLQTWFAQTDVGHFMGNGLPSWLGSTFLGDDPAAQAQQMRDNATRSAQNNASTPSIFGNMVPGTPGTPGAAPSSIFGGSATLAPPPPADGGTTRITPIPMPSAGDPLAGGGKTKPSFDPSQYSVDAIPVAGQVPVSPQAPGAPGSRLVVDPGKVFDAETGLQNARQSVESARVRVLELEADNTSTAQDIAAAKNQVQNSERAYLSAEAKLIEAQRGTYDKMSSAANSMSKGMDQIGAALDNDLGISKGLPGIADNLVRFLASLAAAPMMGQLAAQSAARPNEGSGIIGQLASQGAFGPRFVGGVSGSGSVAAGGGGYGGYGGVAAPGGVPVPGAAVGGEYGLPAGTNTGGYGSGGKGIFPDWVQALGKAFGVTPSTYAGHQETDRHEAGYAPNPTHENRGIDWTGSPQAMQTFADYLKTVPGMEQVIWNGGGVGTGDTVEIAGGRSQPGYFAGDLAGHGNHVHTRQSSPIPLPGGTWGPGGAGPDPIYAGGGQSPVLFGNNPIAGASAGAGMSGFGGAGAATAPGPRPMTTGTPFTAMPGGAGPGLGGAPMDAAMTAASGLDLLAPGAGAAAQTGMKLANRAIQYAGQVAAIGVSGLMETFLPTGSEKASKGWVQKLAAGAAGARPALPNSAGGQTPTQAPGQGGGGVGQSLDKSTTNNITVNNQRATEDGTGKDVAFHLGAQNSGTRW